MQAAGRGRKTAFIRRKPAQAIFRAIDFAKVRGTPLNRYVVINLRESGTASAAMLFVYIRHKFRDWLSYRTQKGKGARTPPAYVYSLEDPQGGHPHVNWMVHVPEDLAQEFAQKLEQWVTKAQGQATRPFDVKVQPVNPRFDKRLGKYVVKGIDPTYIDHFHLQEVHCPQGGVWGKRAGHSPSLGPAARTAAGYVTPRRQRYWRATA